MTRKSASTARVVRIIRKALADGHVVDIEGFGAFRPVENGFEFIPETRPRIFLAYVQEDCAKVRRLYRDLTACGFSVWMDRESLLPGQNWPRSIARAIDISDFFIACFSRASVPKRGVFQSELRYALDCAARQPLDSVFIIPVRFDACVPPQRIAGQVHHVDLFPDWSAGVEKIRRGIDREMTRKRRETLPLAG